MCKLDSQLLEHTDKLRVVLQWENQFCTRCPAKLPSGESRNSPCRRSRNTFRQHAYQAPGLNAPLWGDSTPAFPKPLATPTATPWATYYWAGTTKKTSSRLQYCQGHQWPQPPDLKPAIGWTCISLTTADATSREDTHGTQIPQPNPLVPLNRRPQISPPPAAQCPVAWPPLPAAVV